MGNKGYPCLLCGNKSKSGIEIFGHKGVKLSIKSILFQHFSLEFTDSETESKIVCKNCWRITDEFHQLYCMVKDEFTGQRRLLRRHKSKANHDKKSSIQLPTSPKSEQNEHSVEQSDYIETDVKLESMISYDDPQFIADDHLFDDDLQSTLVKSDLQSDLEIKDENFQQKIEGIFEDLPELDVPADQLTFKQMQAIEQDKEIENSLGIVCELCNKNLITFLGLKKHFRQKHKVIGYVRCCERKYTSRSLLYDHIQDHKNPVRLQCPVCEKTFIDHANLNKHMKRHDPTLKKIQCPNCPKLFEKKSNLNSHIERVHFIGPKTFVCDICEKSFVSKLTITTHLLTVHVQKYSQICDICAKTYKSIKLLDSHYKKKHLGIQLPKVQCSVCGAWLSDKNILRKHMRYHYAKEETCPICGKKAPNRNAMGNHMRKVHSGRIFPCNMCDKKFKSQISLTEHISTHTGYNLYRCSYCPMEFKYGTSLYKHRKVVHPIELEVDRNRKICPSFTPIKKIDTY